MARKKKRSAKQLANDRRLGRMAKARAKKKRGGRRKVTKRNPHKKATRKKAAKRRVSAKSHLWRVFKIHSNGDVKYLGFSKNISKWTARADEAILFKNRSNARAVANNASNRLGGPWLYGAVSESTTIAQIRVACKRGK